MITRNKSSEGAIESLAVWPDDSSCQMFIDKGNNLDISLLFERLHENCMIMTLVIFWQGHFSIYIQSKLQSSHKGADIDDIWLMTLSK